MSAALTLYFDGKCPFCASEMRRLRTWDRSSRLAFVDIALPGFDPAHLNARMEELNLELDSLTAGGQVLVGIDTMLATYTLVGRGWMVCPLRVPLLRPILSYLYRQFARNRYTMSRLLGYKAPACAGGLCDTVNPSVRGGPKP